MNKSKKYLLRELLLRLLWLL